LAKHKTIKRATPKQHYMTKTELLAKLKEEYSQCERCPELLKSRTQVVFGVGDPEKCKVVIIGEAPGAREDELGEPFVGKSGQLLNQFLKKINLTREEVYITNTVLCRPPDNRNPKADELKNCRDRLNKHIEILKPKVVITLGNFATRYLLETKEGITTMRGRVHNKNGMHIIPMQHPAVLLYNGMAPAKVKEFDDDFNLVKGIIDKNN